MRKNSKKSLETKGMALLLTAGFLYSLYGLFSRFIGTNLPLFFLVWVRGAIISAALFLIGFATHTKLKPITKKIRPWVFLACLSSGLLVPTFFTAINHLEIGTMLFFFYAFSTITGYVSAAVLLHETLTKIKVIALALAIIGLLAIFADTFHFGNILYILCACFSGGIFGINITAVRKLHSVFPSLQISLFNGIGQMIVNLFFSLLLREQWSFAITTLPFLVNIGLALCALVASFSAAYGFKFIEVQKGSIILLSEILFGVLIGFIFYHEIPTVLTVIGSVFVLTALALPNITRKT